MTTVKQAYQLIKKAAVLVDKVQDLCLADRDFMATGHTAAGKPDERWVAWVLIMPGCEPMFFDAGITGKKDKTVAELDEPEIDRLTALTWRTPNKISELDMLARAAAAGPSSGHEHKSAHHDAPGHDVQMSASGSVMSVRRIDPTDGTPV